MTQPEHPADSDEGPVVRIPRSLLPNPPPHGSIATLTLRDGRIIKGVLLDMAGLVYGVIVPASYDDEHPVNFTEEDIVGCKPMDMRWQRFLQSRWWPWRRIVI